MKKRRGPETKQRRPHKMVVEFCGQSILIHTTNSNYTLSNPLRWINKDGGFSNDITGTNCWSAAGKIIRM
ncbi:hypothetical protein IAS59_001611 [Cryptococcus gattii]